jgi:hypothetical protein
VLAPFVNDRPEFRLEFFGSVCVLLLQYILKLGEFTPVQAEVGGANDTLNLLHAAKTHDRTSHGRMV